MSNAATAEAITAAVAQLSDERIKQARAWRQNFCVKHGLEFEGSDGRPVSMAAAATNTNDSTPPPTTAVAAMSPPAKSWWARFGLPAAAGAALAASGAGAGYLLSQPSDPVPQPDQSVLQYLEDEGFHVPD